MTTVVALKNREQKDQLAELTIEQLNKWIASPPENSRRAIVTPAVAEHILEVHNNQDHNRTKKPPKIRVYAGNMRDVRWFLTGDTLKFGTDGELKDGQNRLYACVQAGVAFATHMVFGIDPAAFRFIDRGKTKNDADMFRIAGIGYATLTPKAVRWIVLLQTDEVKTRKTFEPDRLLDEYKKLDAGLLEECIKVARAISRAYPNAAPAPNAALYYMFRSKNAAKADSFFNGWANKMPCPAIEKVRDKLLRTAKDGEVRINDVFRAALMVQAWNCFVKGRKGALVNFGWTLNKPFPAIES